MDDSQTIQYYAEAIQYYVSMMFLDCTLIRFTFPLATFQKHK